MRVMALTGATSLVADVARRAGLPSNALAKIFQRLTRHGLLRSRRGPGGGYDLARPAGDISLADVLRAVQDIIPGGRHCLLGNRLCGEGGFCLIHDVIIEADQLVIENLRSLTLADLARSEGWTQGEQSR